jgi:NTP pyrophosphatase (non-canonical NTP hydrolase)
MDLTLNQLIAQCAEDSTRWFPNNQDLANQVLCMAGEVGEVANIVKKVVRGTHELEDVSSNLTEEIIDVLVYLINLVGNEAFEDVDWSTLWNNKRAFNESRFGNE